MNRRNYIKTVGGIALTTQAGVPLGKTAEKVRGAADEQDEVGEDELTEAEKTPVYYTIDIPAIDQQILHVSIHADMLEDLNLLRTKSESYTVGINLSYHEPSDAPWEVFNFSVQDEYLDEVVLGEVGDESITANRWAQLEKEKIALLTTGTGTHGYLGVVGDGETVEIEAPENSWEWPSVEYERVRVETTDQSEIEVTSEGDNIVVFEMDIAHLCSPHSVP
ncbi:hypothetical protein HZS55_13020 [Halosimplex rubrum]|uniref:Uncharacterized protein n=1 Tax=Halosimplex rubrum TaxID=869889 RepID=A0A7D5T515_9EURY|nr:hypothetical protein [Halosimplex rubrum]QLH78170.1 hypothetical protein HZS55_13020 [Halosimplex rubrum]